MTKDDFMVMQTILSNQAEMMRALAFILEAGIIGNPATARKLRARAHEVDTINRLICEHNNIEQSTNKSGVTDESGS